MVRHFCICRLAMASDRGQPARSPSIYPVCDGASADLQLRLCKTVARRGAEFGEFASTSPTGTRFSHIIHGFLFYGASRGS